jgi:hypothetical protein
MSVFIQANNGKGQILRLDATESAGLTLTGRPTQYAVESGVNSSDHYQQDQNTFNISGVISDFKLRGNTDNLSLEDFEKEILAVKDSGEFFAVTFSDNLDVFTDCLFTNVRLNKTSQLGKSALSVNMTIQQVNVADKSSVVLLPVPADQFKDQAEGKSNSNGSTSELSEEESEDLTTLVNEGGIPLPRLFE